MTTRTWQLRMVVLIMLVILLTACAAEPQEMSDLLAPEADTDVAPPVTSAGETAPAPATREPADTSTSPSEVTDTTETSAETVVEEEDTAVYMTLISQKSKTEHSPRPKVFTVPPSTIVAPREDSWRVLEQATPTVFQSYDGVRVTGEGEAWLDLGDLLHLILKRDTVAQFIPGEEAANRLSDIEVAIPGGTPLLQRIVLGMHLTRGGFMGEKLKDNDVIALMTPNAVVIVSGTGFFIAYDPDADRTMVGNFDGTIDVTDGEMQEGDSLPTRQIIAIPPLRDRKFWPIHDHLTFEEFERLIDVLESPIAAADMISGPYLVIETAPDVDVLSGPGPTFSVVGSMAEGDYARIIAEGDGWWQIECPADISGSGSECWAAAGDTMAYNSDVPQTTPTNTATPTPIPVAMCRVSVPSVGFWYGPGGMRGDGGIIYNRIGYLNEGVELNILADGYNGQWYKVELVSLDGVTQRVNLNTGSQGWVFSPYCARTNQSPINPASNIPPTVTVTPSPTPTPTPTNTPTPTPTNTPTPTPTNTPAPTITLIPTPTILPTSTLPYVP